MTAPNAAVGALPGWRGTDPDGGTWVLAARMTAGYSWWYVSANGENYGWRSQEEAEAAGLVAVVAETEVDSAREAVYRDLDRADAKIATLLREKDEARLAAPAALDPGNPEDLRRSLDFLAGVVASLVGGSIPASLRWREAVMEIGGEIKRLDRERAKAEQDASDRKRAEEIAMVAWADGDGYAQWHNAPEQHRTDLIAATLAGIRAGRAERQEAGQ